MANPRYPLLWHNWGDEFVVYHTGSGNTHALDYLAANVLKLLQASPANMAELAETVSRHLDLEQDDDLYEYIERILREFERLGLVEQNNT